MPNLRSAEEIVGEISKRISKADNIENEIGKVAASTQVLWTARDNADSLIEAYESILQYARGGEGEG